MQAILVMLVPLVIQVTRVLTALQVQAVPLVLLETLAQQVV